ncbi:MAG: 6-oxocyclohex-1-ene-1-carbonyl-CoA hydratase [Myxococcales bacterium]
MELANHELVPDYRFRSIRYEERPVRDRKGGAVDGLHAVWIALDNERQLNSYTTQALKEIVLGVRRASADRRAVAVVLTGSGDRAFCTGGNTAEYATLYAGRPAEYAQYMRLFNDAVTSLLLCDKPVVCRVNGMRIGGGQEIGMACDFSVAGDHASFGQAGPVHGSAPDGGSTDFLDLYVGYAFAAESLSLCQPWSAAKAYRLGLLNEVVPVHRDTEGKPVPNPLVVSDRFADDLGRIVYGDWKEGEAKDLAKKRLGGLKIDLAPLDTAIDRLTTKLLYTFPDCTHKTLESLRKKKLSQWFANSETNRSWLALNMNTEAAAGFPAFHFGEKPDREIDFVTLRRRLAEGARFDSDLVREVLPPAARKGWEESRSGS